MAETSFYTQEELADIGFKSIGENVLISRKSSIYGADKISIGSNVRIDDFCILSGYIEMGDYVHIASFVALYGGPSYPGIVLGNFTGISSRSTIYAVNDDYSGDFLTSPVVPEKFTNVKNESVFMKDYAILGANVTVLPGVTIEEGVAVGAYSLVVSNLKPWMIYTGIPAKINKKRSQGMKQIIDEEQL